MQMLLGEVQNPPQGPCWWQRMLTSDAGDVEGLVSEEDGTVMVRDDLDALLQVCS